MFKALTAILDWALEGIRLEWSPDSGVGDPLSHLYGFDTIDKDYSAYETLITKRVVSVESFGDSTYVYGFRFGHPDGTKTSTFTLASQPANIVNKYTILGNFIGMNTAFDINFNRWIMRYTYVAVFDDIGGDPCSLPAAVSFVPVTDVLYYLRQAEVSVSYGVSHSALCFTIGLSLRY